jgi:hypothetical protein
MKKIVLALLIFCSCSNAKYEKIGQEILDGKVSAYKEGHSNSGEGTITYPKIWVQTETQTVEVEIPLALEGRWKVGDSCLLIIEKYKEVDK